MPGSMIHFIPKAQSTTTRGVEYRVANGRTIPNRCQRRVDAVAKEGHTLSGVAQVTVVPKLRLSV